MKPIFPLIIALLFHMTSCAPRGYVMESSGREIAEDEEDVASVPLYEEISSVPLYGETIYLPPEQMDQTVLQWEADTVNQILRTFSVEKISNELARRNPLHPTIDSTLIDSLVFSFPDSILQKAMRFSKYREKTGDSTYYNAIYDFRHELWEIDDDSISKNARAVAMIVPTSMLTKKNGRWYMQTKPFHEFRQLCPGEKFFRQPCSVVCGGTGFAIAPQYVVTAFHSVIQYRKDISVIYGFVPDSVRNGVIEIPPENIYSARVTKAHGAYDVDTNTYPGGDFAVLKTSRPIPDDRILQLVRPDTLPVGDLYMIGHPDGLSLKVISKGRIIGEKDPLQYHSEMHSMPGCSGAPVFDSDNRVIAIQLGRESGGDYELTVHDGSPCMVTRRCPTLQCEGMDLLKIEVIINALSKLE